MIMIKTLQFIFQTPNFWLVWKNISPVVYFLWIPIFKDSLICILKGNENLQRTSAHCNMWWIDFTVMYVYVLHGWLHYIYVHVQSMKKLETSELTKYAEQYYIWYDDKFLFWSNTNLHFDDMMMMLYMYISKKVKNHLAVSCKLHGSPQRLHHHALEIFCNATNLITSKLKSFKKKVDNSINDLNTDCYRYLMSCLCSSVKIGTTPTSAKKQ